VRGQESIGLENELFPDGGWVFTLRISRLSDPLGIPFVVSPTFFLCYANKFFSLLPQHMKSMPAIT
jgi:hypothetical protein